MPAWTDLLARFRPTLAPVSPAEWLRAGSGALIGLVVTGVATRFALGADAPLPLLIAPMGASSVLLFAVPASPLAQPWSLIGGNLVAGLVGVTAAQIVPDALLAAGLAAGLAIALMLALRCLHPPSGAVALTAVLGGEAVRSAGYAFILAPVLLNSLLLLAAALAFNAATGRQYPAAAPAAGRATRDPAPSARLGFSAADLDAALKQYDRLLDVSRADLEQVLRLAEVRAYARRSGEIRCADIMSRDVVAIAPEASMREALHLLRGHHVKALPVTTESARVVGIVTQSDLLDKAAWGIKGPRVAFAQRLRHVVRLARAPQGSVQEIMTVTVRAARPETPIADLVPLMADGGLHAVPVVDSNDQLAGIVTQSDLIAALFRDRLAGPQAGAT
ncbi:HPP family protein [Aquabacter spiritensis]|uniref:CBS domain-containing membrane protein n=1 Tax=Aquabacter spiritensis TaxID=933073 RepID=A0A4R3M5W4_9HYPH|nr:HPP family protein [Aquabacter spiritensis]TCT06635.1 CBS domain-containing membrane protein [Aquabacter spiritensis]